VQAGYSQYYNCCGTNLTGMYYRQALWIRVS